MSDETKVDNPGKEKQAKSASTSGSAVLPGAQPEKTPPAPGPAQLAPRSGPDPKLGAMPLKRAHILVLGNEKGGSGKTTTAMHLITGLLHQGYRVGSMDLDGRQRSLTRYVENRQVWMDQNSVTLPMPAHTVIARSELDTVTEREADERARFEFELAKRLQACDVVLLDCPGTDTFLSRLGHACADTLLTPMNDSFVDFDLLGRVDPENYDILGPSVYSEMVWDARKRRAISDGGTIDQLQKTVDNLSQGIDDRADIMTLYNPGEFHLGCLRPCMHTHNFSILDGTLYLTSITDHKSVQKSLTICAGIYF